MLLEIEDLVKEYRNGVRANDGISLSIEEGEVFGLLGPNGAGKSTLVNQIIGLLAPTSGTITLAGTDIIASPDYGRANSSYQPQGHVPIDGFTPAQAIELIGRLRGGSKRDVRARTQELIDRLDIREWADRRAQQLSGGVRRLVGFAMAVVCPAKLVILDEPTNDIDPLRRRLLWAEVIAIAEQGAAVLLVTHNVLEAERAVNRLAIVNKGTVQATGTPASLKGDEADSLRMEVILEPGVDVPAIPARIEYVRAGRRLIATVRGDDITGALDWARHLQRQGIVEEYSLGPSTLEDVYVRIVGPDAPPLSHGGNSATAGDGES